jgi:hypothetical protein
VTKTENKSASSSKQFGRRTTSLILFISGIIVFITSLVLYIGPPTHVAHFSDWRMAGLSKCQWNAVHIMTGLLFIITLFFHVYFNWKMVLAYLKNRKSRIILFTKPFTLSLIITAYVCTGTLLDLPPMGQIIQWIRSVKIGHVQTYGAPPYGQAEYASLKNIKILRYIWAGTRKKALPFSGKRDSAWNPLTNPLNQ